MNKDFFHGFILGTILGAGLATVVCVRAIALPKPVEHEETTIYKRSSNKWVANKPKIRKISWRGK